MNEKNQETTLQKAKRKLKPPKTPGECIDRLYQLREERLDHQHKAEELQAQFTALEEHVLKEYKKAGLEGARGKRAQCSVSVKTVGRITDRDKLEAYVKRTGAFELITYQMNNKAYRERLDDKKTVPGVAPFDVTRLSVTAAKGRKK